VRLALLRVYHCGDVAILDNQRREEELIGSVLGYFYVFENFCRWGPTIILRALGED